MATRSNLYSDLLYFIKTDLSSNITDPLSGKRNTSSQFVMTSYPHKETQYPLITIKILNYEANRTGMQTDRLDITLQLEVRVWCKSQTQRDKLTQQIINRLASIQFSTSGSIDSDFHDFNVLSALDVDEAEIKLFSKVLNFQYRFFDA